jgi:hypothetical protein
MREDVRVVPVGSHPAADTARRAAARGSSALGDALVAEEAVAALRERVRVARHRAGERRRRGMEALAAGQEAFARGLLDAADAHDHARREAEARLFEAERRRAALLARAAQVEAA